MPEFNLQTDPSEQVCFTSEKLGEESVTAVIKITNPTAKTVAWKVKCTSNEMFRIRPPVGMLGPQKKEDVKVIFNAGKTVPDDNKHYFVVYYISAKDDADAKKPARQLWLENANVSPEGSRRLHVFFKRQAPAAANAKDTKKDDDNKDEDKKEVKEEDKKEVKEDDKNANDKPKKEDEDEKKDSQPADKKEDAKKQTEAKKDADGEPTDDKKDGGADDKKDDEKKEEDE